MGAKAHKKGTSGFAPTVRLIETVVARILVIFHVGLLIFRGVILGKDIYFTLPLSCAVLLIIPEAIFTYTKTRAEWKWFCPAILLYTCSTLPQIWMLELDMMDEKRVNLEENVLAAVEVAFEIQRQANIDPDGPCSLATGLVEAGLMDANDEIFQEQKKINDELAALEGQKKCPDTENVPQAWRERTKLFGEPGVTAEMRRVVDGDIETSPPETKCWQTFNDSQTLVLDFKRVLVIKKIVIYTGLTELNPASVSVIPLETEHRRVIPPKDKQDYALHPTRTSGKGYYVIDLETSLIVTKVFQYLEIKIDPVEQLQSICEVELEYSDNYLSAQGSTQYYNPKIALTSHSDVNQRGKTEDVNKLYDDDPTSCATVYSIKLLIEHKEAHHISDDLLLEQMVIVPGPYGGELNLVADNGMLNQTISLSDTIVIDLPPGIEEADNLHMTTTENSARTVKLCELKFLVQLKTDKLDTETRIRRDEESQIVHSHTLKTWSHMIPPDPDLVRRVRRQLKNEEELSREKRAAGNFAPTNTFVLLDKSAEAKAFITLIMEQLTMVTLLFIRWVIPRPPSMNAEQLAGTLAGWMGMMADQLNLLVLLDEEPVFTHPFYVYLVMTLFSLSQLQFWMVFPARVASDPDKPKTLKTRLFGSFLWNSLCVLLLQDIPFASCRLYAIFSLKVTNHTVAYFIGKNLIVIFVQAYRMSWLLLHEKWRREKKAELEKTMADTMKLTPDKLGLFLSNGVPDLPNIPFADDERDDPADVILEEETEDDEAKQVKQTLL